MNSSETVLSLDSKRRVKSGSTEILNERIAVGSDIRICTGFLHNEHIDIRSDDNQLVIETSSFAQTVLIDGKWSAYFMTLRQPVALREGFGYPNALSLFLYNQDGHQAMARLVMDGSEDKTIRQDCEDFGMKKTRTTSIFDEGTPGVSKNFIYDFEFYDYIADGCYEEIYANTKTGGCMYGNIDILEKAYGIGRGIKISVKGLSNAIWGPSTL